MELANLLATLSNQPAEDRLADIRGCVANLAPDHIAIVVTRRSGHPVRLEARPVKSFREVDGVAEFAAFIFLKPVSQDEAKLASLRADQSERRGSPVIIGTLSAEPQEPATEPLQPLGQTQPDQSAESDQPDQRTKKKAAKKKAATQSA